jgi:hypothetical protein
MMCPPSCLLAARAAVNAVDPVGLIAAGCPDDEYDPEVKALIKRRGPVTPEGVAKVFIRYLGRDYGRVTPDDAARVAEGINAACAAHPSR